ncbi:MAG: hypothetical protein ACOVO9_14750 [Bacteroidia bacterium]
METEILFSSNVKFRDRFINIFRWSLIFTPLLILFLIATPINFSNLYSNIPYLIIIYILSSTTYISYKSGKYYIQEIKIHENQVCLKALKFNNIHIDEKYDVDKVKIFKKPLNTKYPKFKLQISYMGKIIISQFEVSDWDEKMMDTVIYNFNEKVKNRING